MDEITRSLREPCRISEYGNVYTIDIPYANGKPDPAWLSGIHANIQRTLRTNESLLWYCENDQTSTYSIEIRIPWPAQWQLNRHKTLLRLKDFIAAAYPETKEQRRKRLGIKEIPAVSEKY